MSGCPSHLQSAGDHMKLCCGVLDIYDMLVASVMLSVLSRCCHSQKAWMTVSSWIFLAHPLRVNFIASSSAFFPFRFASIQKFPPCALTLTQEHIVSSSSAMSKVCGLAVLSSALFLPLVDFVVTPSVLVTMTFHGGPGTCTTNSLESVVPSYRGSLC